MLQVPMTSLQGRLNPGSLQQITIEYIKDNLEQQFLILENQIDTTGSGAKNRKLKEPQKKRFKLRTGVALPHSLWDILLRGHKRIENEHISLLLALSDVPGTYRMQKLFLRNAVNLTDGMLKKLIVNYPTELDIHNCPGLTANAFQIINTYGNNLETLVIGSSVQILPAAIGHVGIQPESDTEQVENTVSAWSALIQKIPKLFGITKKTSESVGTQIPDSLQSLNTPNLRKLVIWGLHVQQKQTDAKLVELDYWKVLFEAFIDKLVVLDLSSCQEFVDFNFILGATGSLQCLILHDVLIPDDPLGWEILKQMKTLRFLDVSQSMELAAVYRQPDILLADILNSLTDLSGLDISGTNLAGHNENSILGLESRDKTPLDFLGLLGTHFNPSKRSNIPAKRIAGNTTREQLMESLIRYMDRPILLQKTLRVLYGKLSNAENDFYCTQQCLNLVIEVLERYLDDKHVQLIGLCVLFNVMKRFKSLDDGSGFAELYYTSKIRQRIVRCVMVALRSYTYDLALLRNGLLVLCLMDITKDLDQVLHEVVDFLLLSIELSLGSSELFLLRTSYFILKPIIGIATVENKKRFGAAGIIKRLCAIMETCMLKNALEHMSTNWILLEYLTDNVDENCELFIKSGGLDVFLKLKMETPIDVTVATAALGVLSNAASVPVNHKHFKKPVYCNAVFMMMDASESHFRGVSNIKDKNRLSYAATSCIVYLLEASSWNPVKPKRPEILQKLEQLVKSWDYSVNMGIEFTTLKPILKIITASEPECKSFAAWSLANLTSIDPMRYFPMLGDLNSFERICKMEFCTSDDNTNHQCRMTLLGNVIIENLKQYGSRQSQLEIL